MKMNTGGGASQTFGAVEALSASVRALGKASSHAQNFGNMRADCSQERCLRTGLLVQGL